jgi:hypothetical protein
VGESTQVTVGEAAAELVPVAVAVAEDEDVALAVALQVEPS